MGWGLVILSLIGNQSTEQYKHHDRPYYYPRKNNVLVGLHGLIIFLFGCVMFDNVHIHNIEK